MCQFPEEFQTLYSARLGPANLAFKFQDAIVYHPHWRRGNGSIEQSYGIFPESSFSIWACFLEAHGGVHTCLLCPWACQPLQELCGSFIGAPDGVCLFLSPASLAVDGHTHSCGFVWQMGMWVFSSKRTLCMLLLGRENDEDF